MAKVMQADEVITVTPTLSEELSKFLEERFLQLPIWI